MEGIPHPGEKHALVGHEKTSSALLRLFHSGRLHHGLILSGEKGIGKCTLALRLAAHVLRTPEPATVPPPDSLEVIDDTVQGQISAGAHPNLLHLSRPWDAQTKQFKTKLVIEEVRKTVKFFGTSRGQGGWRVAIVDATDDMNRNAANALLKVLEEPPDNTIFIVLAHSMASVLPTIRSRCLHFPMQHLSEAEVFQALSGLGLSDDVSETDTDLLMKLSEGSVRRAIILLQQDGLELYNGFQSIVSSLSKIDWEQVHVLGEKVSARGANEKFELLIEFALFQMEAFARGNDGNDNNVAVLARWAQLWEKTRNSVRLSKAYNLDRKQVVL